MINTVLKQITREDALAALNEIKLNYDALFNCNSYIVEGNTHEEQFNLIASIPGYSEDEEAGRALGWIHDVYDLYHIDEMGDDSAFAYLEKFIKRNLK